MGGRSFSHTGKSGYFYPIPYGIVLEETPRPVQRALKTLFKSAIENPWSGITTIPFIHPVTFMARKRARRKWRIVAGMAAISFLSVLHSCFF